MTTLLELQHFAVLQVAYLHKNTSILITCTTNNPCHLTCYYTDKKPVRHTTSTVKRGVSLPWGAYFCFVAWKSVEQQEPGDTLTHTFEIPDWSYCQIKWFTFRGTVAGELSPSVTALIKHHHSVKPVIPPFVIDTLEFDPVRGVAPDIIHVAGNVYAIAYNGPDSHGFLKTVRVNSDGSIDDVIDTLEFDPVQCVGPAIINVAGDVYAIAYAGRYDHGFLKTVSISDDGSIGAVIATLEFDPARGYTLDFIHLWGDLYAVAYEGYVGRGFLKTLSIYSNGSIGPVIDTLEFDPTRGRFPTIIRCAGAVHAIAYSGPDYDGFLKTVSIGAGGSIGPVIDTLEFDPVLCHETDIIHVAGDVYAIAYRGPDQHGFLKTVTINDHGSIAAVIDTLEFDPFYCVGPVIIHVSGTMYAIAYSGLGSDGFLKTISISDDGSIGAVIATLEFDPVRGTGPDIIFVAVEVYAIAYCGPDLDGFLKTVGIP